MGSVVPGQSETSEEKAEELAKVWGAFTPRIPFRLGGNGCEIPPRPSVPLVGGCQSPNSFSVTLSEGCNPYFRLKRWPATLRPFGHKYELASPIMTLLMKFPMQNFRGLLDSYTVRCSCRCECVVSERINMSSKTAKRWQPTAIREFEEPIRFV